ncbi:hypothetical protein HYH03_015932 [Edaphochlamys debaryana]|uniref:DUF4214 domain-containing protein n=1 Tax=Edaphochlamys debaryana TaxID=47281 RepID=A0A836BQF4_9CHLO|nr:hypothetical protein HYH03_015932 [Edaphochlamys debaryana]|eukprot:KAG2485351.1 hypothetical protein HYH03_015932 [Edaphochlamys debaryana]
MSAVSGVVVVVLVLVASIAIFAVVWVWQSTLFGQHGSLNLGGSKTSQRERFESGAPGVQPAVSAESRSSVSKAFERVLGRAPTPAELDFYAGEVSSARLSVEDVAGLLKISTNLKPQPVHELYPDKEAYNTVVDAFASTLFRLPSEAELDTHYKLLTRGALNKSTLHTVIQGTAEFKNANQAPLSKASTKDGKDGSKNVGGTDGVREGFRQLSRSYIGDLVVDTYYRTFQAMPAASLVNEITDKFDGIEDDDETALVAYVAGLRPAPDQASTTPPPTTLNADDVDDVDVNMVTKEDDDTDDEVTDDALYTRLQAAQGRSAPPTFTNRDLVLQKRFNWQVPQRRPPVCTPHGRGCTVFPQFSQTALIGTLLDDAKDTRVGSILPVFEYREREA